MRRIALLSAALLGLALLIAPARACDGVATQASLGYAMPVTASYAATTYAVPAIQSSYILQALPVTTGVATTAIVQPQVQVQAAQQVVQAETYASPPTLAATTYATAAPVTVLAATPSVNYASPLLFAGSSYGYGSSFGNLAAVGYSNRAFFGATNGYGFNRGFSSLGYGGFNRGLAFSRGLATVPIVQQRRVGGLIPGAGRALFGRRVVGAAVAPVVVAPRAAFVAPRAFVGRGAFVGGRRSFIGGRRFR